MEGCLFFLGERNSLARKVLKCLSAETFTHLIIVVL